VLLAGVIGIVIGALAGYCGGWADAILSRMMEVFLCFPAMFLILAVMVWIRGGATHVILVIGLTRWTPIARLVRAELLKQREADFVLAARCSGASTPWIIVRHVLPCATAPVLVALAFGVSDAVMIEAGLSWLGFGVAAPHPSWGNMLREAYDHIRAAPHLVAAPCAALLATVFAFHLIGEGLRRVLDPRTAPAN
jgi:peptide/nickel transport system permease protein